MSILDFSSAGRFPDFSGTVQVETEIIMSDVDDTSAF